MGEQLFRLVSAFWICNLDVYLVPKVHVLRQGAKSDKSQDGIFWFCSTDKRENFFSK